MKFTRNIEMALEKWLRPEWWNTPPTHPHDACRFYDFVEVVWRESRTIDEARIIREARRLFPNRFQKGSDTSDLREKLSQTKEMLNCLEYLENKGVLINLTTGLRQMIIRSV
ncbi:MAG: hypothetical protein HY282_05045 [Nitrospirae bacterium]|nr:hypothetical protein [Candidatus Manganitrophaceae bacterium]